MQCFLHGQNVHISFAIFMPAPNPGGGIIVELYIKTDFISLAICLHWTDTMRFRSPSLFPFCFYFFHCDKTDTIQKNEVISIEICVTVGQFKHAVVLSTICKPQALGFIFLVATNFT